jgi:Tfp pilus assembly protein PilF
MRLEMDARIRLAWLVLAALITCCGGCQSPAGGSRSWLPWTKPARPGLSQASLPSEVPAPLRPEQKAEIQMALAMSAERQGRTDEAKMIYHDVIKAAPKRADAYHRLALLQSRQGECEAAEEHYLKAVQLAPGNAQVHGDHGYNYYLQEKWPAAEASLRRAIELDGEFARARNNLGMLLARTGREAEAIQQFAKGGCDRAQVSCNLALAMTLEGRIEEAQQEYQRALQHNPKLDHARDMLATLKSLPGNRRVDYMETSSPMPLGVAPAWHHEGPRP